MRYRHILHTLLSTAALAASAQEETSSTPSPFYLPGEGMYLVGLPHNLQPAVSEPTIITQAYQAMPRLSGVELVSIRAGVKSYNLSNRISDDATTLDMRAFMGIGTAYNLTVRNFEGESYTLGDHAPKKTWYNNRILAATPNWLGRETYPLAVYDQWDCPITYDADPVLSAAGSDVDGVTVNFGNPHEGLVARNVNFTLIVTPDADLTQTLDVVLDIWDDDRRDIVSSLSRTVTLGTLPTVATFDDGTRALGVEVPLATGAGRPIVIRSPFEVSVEGLAAMNGQAWLPRAVDHTGLYPSHTTYTSGLQLKDDRSDVCINVEGYFNYIGTWGWWDGKTERGEVVASADLVQIYYDPADADWPGDYFMGEASFPIETTFGSSDIAVVALPDWINSVSYDNSQWEEYGCVQISLAADALPDDLSGRNGAVVLGTLDGASFYTIYLRQGAADFDFTATTGVDFPLVPETVQAPGAGGALYNLQGHRLTAPRRGEAYVRDGRLCIDL